MDYPNQGTIWHNAEKKHEKAPDFSGSMLFEKDFLQDLFDKSKNGKRKLGEVSDNLAAMLSPFVKAEGPIKRVDTPQDVAHTYSCLLALSINFTSKAFAKF